MQVQIIEPNMKAYVVLLTLLFIFYIDGYETKDCLDFSRHIAKFINVNLENINPLHKTTRKESPSDFYLFTKDNPTNGQRLFLDDVAGLQNSNFNMSRPTIFVTHGFVNDAEDCPITEIRDAYLEHGDYNIIGIDWNNTSYKFYLQASNQVPTVSKFIGEFIKFLHQHGLDLSTVTIIGHSLGAHVAGLSARSVGDKIGKVALVVALDPAYPWFAHAKPGKRVDRTDADYVIVIHTNSGVAGFEKAIGHVDFYPNGGNVQPGCVTFDWYEKIPANVCSHLRSYEYFAESINSDKFVAVQCEKYSKFKTGACKSNAKVSMGGVNPDHNAKGTYFLDTNQKYPYAQGDVVQLIL